jgi:hypothetical protein
MDPVAAEAALKQLAGMVRAGLGGSSGSGSGSGAGSGGEKDKDSDKDKGGAPSVWAAPVVPMMGAFVTAHEGAAAVVAAAVGVLLLLVREQALLPSVLRACDAVVPALGRHVDVVGLQTSGVQLMLALAPSPSASAPAPPPLLPQVHFMAVRTAMHRFPRAVPVQLAGLEFVLRVVAAHFPTSVTHGLPLLVLATRSGAGAGAGTGTSPRSAAAGGSGPGSGPVQGSGAMGAGSARTGGKRGSKATGAKGAAVAAAAAATVSSTGASAASRATAAAALKLLQPFMSVLLQAMQEHPVNAEVQVLALASSAAIVSALAGGLSPGSVPTVVPISVFADCARTALVNHSRCVCIGCKG